MNIFKSTFQNWPGHCKMFYIWREIKVIAQRPFKIKDLDPITNSKNTSGKMP